MSELIALLDPCSFTAHHRKVNRLGKAYLLYLCGALRRYQFQLQRGTKESGHCWRGVRSRLRPCGCLGVGLLGTSSILTCVTGNSARFHGTCSEQFQRQCRGVSDLLHLLDSGWFRSGPIGARLPGTGNSAGTETAGMAKRHRIASQASGSTRAWCLWRQWLHPRA